MVIAADKEKALLVMDCDKYVQRMEDKFSDTSTYIKIQKDLTQEIRQEIIDQLIYLENSGYIDKKTHLELHPNRADTSSLWKPKETLGRISSEENCRWDE